jgi:tripartite-type tricarboxylate transporter receptor subunit TctC
MMLHGFHSGMRASVSLFSAALIVVITICTTEPARAQSVEEFYANTNVSLYIGYSVGGGYDLYGRLVARHIGRHIPGNPTVVPVNMEGAGSLRLANWLYSAAPRDGSVIGTVNQGAAFTPLLGEREFAEYDPAEFIWLGSANDEITVCVAMDRTGISSLDQLYDEELIIGGTGPGADEYFLHELLRGVLDVRIRSITGYPGGNEINAAMERGEVDGRCGWSWASIKVTKPDWLEQEMIHVLLQLGLQKHPELPDIPLIMDLADTEQDRQLLALVMASGPFGRPFLAPPDVPADRAAALEAAFSATVVDPDFLAEAKTLRAEIRPVSSAALIRLLSDVYATSPELVERARAMLR